MITGDRTNSPSVLPLLASFFLLAALPLFGERLANAETRREASASKGDIALYLAPGSSTQVNVPGGVFGAFFNKGQGISLSTHDDALIITRPSPPAPKDGIPFVDRTGEYTLAKGGAAVIVQSTLKRFYSARVFEPTGKNPGDTLVALEDSAGGSAFSREITASPKEEWIYVSEAEPSILVMPDLVERVYRNQESPLHFESADNLVALYPSYDPIPFGDCIVVQLQNGRVYGFRIMPADAAHAREPTIRVTDNSPIPVYGNELEAKGEVPVYTSIGEATAIFFPDKIKTQFDSTDLIGVDLKVDGKMLIVVPLPTASPPSNRISVSLANGQTYKIKVLPASATNKRVWSMKIR